jgi:hypothetical protein
MIVLDSAPSSDSESQELGSSLVSSESASIGYRGYRLYIASASTQWWLIGINSIQKLVDVYEQKYEVALE